MDTNLSPEAERAAAGVGIPPCPAVLTRLVREARADEPDLVLIGKLIESDVGLAATMLKVANSVLYSGATPLVSIRQALLRIGLDNVIQLITGLLLKQAFPVSASESMEQFWTSSARIAELSSRIARASRAADRELAYSFGLFRHCGAAALLCRHADYDRLVAAAAKIGCRLTDAERARWGADHAQVGYLTARQWMLPAVLCDAVLHHHSQDALEGRREDLDAQSARLIAIGALADRVHELESGERLSVEVEAAAGQAMAQLSLSESDVVAMAA